MGTENQPTTPNVQHAAALSESVFENEESKEFLDLRLFEGRGRRNRLGLNS